MPVGTREVVKSFVCHDCKIHKALENYGIGMNNPIVNCNVDHSDSPDNMNIGIGIHY